MERLNVNPTRMMLTTLKRRLVTARRGHKLMKDKRDQLMKGFLELARENKRLREEVEQELSRVYESFSVASAVMSHCTNGASTVFHSVSSSVVTAPRHAVSSFQSGCRCAVQSAPSRSNSCTSTGCSTSLHSAETMPTTFCHPCARPSRIGWP